MGEGGRANQITFDSAKESFAILSVIPPAGDAFKLLGVNFGPHLSMTGAALDTAHEATWRPRTLLRTRRFYSDAGLVGLFKAHIVFHRASDASTCSCDYYVFIAGGEGDA